MKKLNNFRTVRRREGSKTGDGRQARINIAGTSHRSLLPGYETEMSSTSIGIGRMQQPEWIFKPTRDLLPAYDPTRGVMTVQSNG